MGVKSVAVAVVVEWTLYDYNWQKVSFQIR